MGQVPKYTILGDGRVARHLSHYFDLLQIPYKTWARKTHSESELPKIISSSEVVFILLKDAVIESFVKEHSFLREKRLIHFSGSLIIKGVSGMHPLMSFAEALYCLEEYQKIPFVVEKGSLTFTDIFPTLKNASFELEKEQKALYHAYSVMAGNFSSLLWKMMFEGFETKLQLPREMIFPYLDQITKNLKHDASKALTGPLIRKEKEVVQKHLELLKDSSEREIYQAFVKAYYPEYGS